MCRKVYSVGIAFELQQFNLNVFKECLILQKRNQAFHCCKKTNNDKKVVLRWNRVGESVYKTMDLNFGMAFRG